MDLWIRTQKRNTLIKVDEINLFNLDFYRLETPSCVLGDYKTKQRALEVLDEIQNILIDYSKMTRVVYKMPEE